MTGLTVESAKIHIATTYADWAGAALSVPMWGRRHSDHVGVTDSSQG